MYKNINLLTYLPTYFYTSSTYYWTAVYSCCSFVSVAGDTKMRGAETTVKQYRSHQQRFSHVLHVSETVYSYRRTENSSDVISDRFQWRH